MPEVTYVGLAALQARAIAAIAEAVPKAAEDLVGRSMAAAPVDTGTLRASIHVDDVSVGASEVTAKVATGGESSEYSIFQHEGTSRGVPATKFLERPLLAMAPVYREYIARAARSAF